MTLSGVRFILSVMLQKSRLGLARKGAQDCVKYFLSASETVTVITHDAKRNVCWNPA